VITADQFVAGSPLEFSLKVSVTRASQTPPVFVKDNDGASHEVFVVTLKSDGGYQASWTATEAELRAYLAEHAHLAPGA